MLRVWLRCESIVLLRNDPGGDGSKGRSTLDAGLVGRDIDDLQRYLDATRAEVLFARGVILVEGAAELFLVPAVAQALGKPLGRVRGHGLQCARY